MADRSDAEQALAMVMLAHSPSFRSDSTSSPKTLWRHQPSYVRESWWTEAKAALVDLEELGFTIEAKP